MLSENLKKLIVKYKALGIKYSNELLMPPKIAISLIGELSKNDVMVVGCDLWRYLDKRNEGSGFVTLIGAGIGLDNFKDLAPEQTGEMIQAFLIYQLPNDAELVSLILIDPEVDQFFVG
jgi:hypothetical protein